MPLLPFHKYLGPGNDLDNGDPVDEDDRVAQSHDSAYETALTAKDISDADERAINEFWTDFSTTGNWHSLLGATGLTVKNQIEKRVGVIYPDMSTRHKYKPLALKNRGEERRDEQKVNRQNEQDIRRDSTQDPSQPSTSRDVSDIGQDETNAPMSTDAVDAPQAENALPGTGDVTNPSNNLATLYMNKSLAGSGITFFRKSRLMHTWGFGTSKFAWGPEKSVDDFYAYNTSLGYVPVDWIPLYLSPVEWEMLPPGSYIKEVYVEIIPKGVRCSFDTGTTLTSTANSMHVIYGKHVVGLNHTVDMVNLKLKHKADKPMTIESVEPVTKDEFTTRFYGNADEYHSKEATNMPCSWGANRAIPCYACIMASTNTSTKNYYHRKTGWPRIDNIVDKYNLNEHINIPIVQYSYKPRNGVLKTLRNSAVVPNKVQLYTGHTPMGLQQTQFLEKHTFQCSLEQSTPIMSELGAYESIAEKNHFFAGANSTIGTRSQPQVHIGIDAVQSNAPSDTEPQFVNASADYEIKATCVVGFNSNMMYASGLYGSKLDFNSGFFDINQHYFIGQNHPGGFYVDNWNGKYSVGK